MKQEFNKCKALSMSVIESKHSNLRIMLKEERAW